VLSDDEGIRERRTHAVRTSQYRVGRWSGCSGSTERSEMMVLVDEGSIAAAIDEA
jgi:hypothetical protein